MTRYAPTHHSQYEPGSSGRTRVSGCSWTSAANGADASTGGRLDPTPDQVLALVAPSEETNPLTPGWSLQDVDLAMSRLGVPFEIRSGQGWTGVIAALDAGLYVVLQGDSDRFADGCSGAFDGDHAIGVHPDRDSAGLQRIDDPICPTARFERRAVLRAYAEKFEPSVSFGVFTTPVPLLPPDTSTEDIVRVFSVPGSFSGSWPAGTPVYPGATGAATGKLTTTRRLLVVGQDKPTSPTRHLVDGAGDGPSSAMAWLPVAGMTGRRDESFNAGVAAAAKAAAGAKR